MWNFSFIYPTLLILFILLVFYFSLPRLGIRQNKVFLKIIIIETLVVISDIVSSVMDNNYQDHPLALVSVANMMYFIFFMLRAYILFSFVISVLHIYPRKFPAIKYFVRMPLYLSLVVAAFSPFTGMIYIVNETGYHAGPFYNVIYYCSFFYLGLAFLSFFIKRDVLVRKRELFSLLFYNVIIGAGLIFRILLPNYLLMDTFCLMAILLVYLSFENPEFYLDLRSTAFNRKALTDFLDERAGNQWKNYICLIIHDYSEMRAIYGSTQMDDALHMISDYLNQLFPKAHIFYFSRGRFVILADSRIDKEGACENIAQRFESPWKSEDSEVYLNVDFAIFTSKENKLSAEVIEGTITTALDRADFINDRRPLYIGAKDIEETKKELEIERCFEHAIENGKIEAFLQPIIDVESGRIIGAEALARLRDEEGNVIPPHRFIPIAESTGRVHELGVQVFEKACVFIKESGPEMKGLSWINVNLSPIQMLQADLAEQLESIANKHGVDTELIHLEITEESTIDDYSMQHQITALKDKGFVLVLDDYGTGYSNLARLKKIPFTTVKLDMDIVLDYYHNPDEVLPMMIKTFKQLGFKITAEGIENEHMSLVLAELGCDYFQGFYYSTPVPMHEFSEKYLKPA